MTYWDIRTGKRKEVRVKRGKFPTLPKHFNSDWVRQQLKSRRNPSPYNGYARELFASDILAAKEGRLIHNYEERQKELLNIGEELGLRGPHVDDLLSKETKYLRELSLGKAIEDLKGMTLTVIEGDFPREVIRDEDLTMIAYNKPKPWKKSLAPEPVIFLLLALVIVGILFRARFKTREM